jgi:hypothetical protein
MHNFVVFFKSDTCYALGQIAWQLASTADIKILSMAAATVYLPMRAVSI